MTHAILAEGLSRRFGSTRALDGLDLAVREGSVMSLLGPNGSGKTTTVRVLATLLRPDSGRATVAGLDVLKDMVKLRRKIGLSGQYAAVDEDLTARENLRMVGRLYHLGATAANRRADELLERFGLASEADRQVKGYSGGMRRRVDLACAVISRPEVLFLDEPTTGLDVRSRRALWEVISELVGEGSTLLLTTQYLEEADELSDRITVVDRGRVIAEGTPDELKARVGSDRLELTLANAQDLTTARRLMVGIAEGDITADEKENQLVVPVGDGSEALVAAIRRLDGEGLGLVGAGLRRPTLDEAFLALTENFSTGPRDKAGDAERAGAAQKEHTR
ncbi:ATP-binding cassette domain-containing protein [Streptomyces mutabilis]|uniref:ATP-binding cassette domain-containing protein n=1 Tax=Streptomyces mutabilis TaxID=67332 RepID=UPI0022BA50F1|nr:ATP-binding cassette domain-containing protein [Streptomyces mutabilis]MCZ9353800.1 ATP-binding cassette domain-containing protein [Streptomyces mutabilis]